MQKISRKSSIKILTNHMGQKSSPTWKEVTTYLPPEGNGFIPSFKLAIRLYTKRLNYDCVVLGAGRSDMFFSLMQALLPFRRVPVIMIDCLWYISSNKLNQTIKKLVFKIMDKCVYKYIVWSSCEIKAYAQAFDLYEDKFVFVPYHTTLAEFFDVKPVEGDYIFSGGNFGRDYKPLIEAVRDLQVKLCIGSTRQENLLNISSIPENVDIRGYSYRDFLEKMAGCRINVVALVTDELHKGGQQTFLNSMLLGKPTIVTDPEGAIDYIEHGVDGLLVPNDPSSIRKAILWLMDNPEKSAEMGKKAMQKAKQFSTEEHFKKIVSIANKVICKTT